MTNASRLEYDRPASARTSSTEIPLHVVLGVLLIAALLLVGVTLDAGVGPSDSVVYNTVWVNEFSDALGRGEWPPRWLPGAFGGLGAPSFYYYPPLSFYVAALVDAVTLHRLNALQVTAWANLALLMASGGGMFAWLRPRTGDHWALIGAVAFMAAPYHTIDFYFRGAFAEVTAFAVLPWLLLGLERAASNARGVAWLALAYAGLILSHLPTAMLVTLIVIPAVVGWRLWTAVPAERLAIALRCLAGGVLGLALAALYLGPALLMQDSAQMTWLWGGDTDAWGLLAFKRWPPGDFMTKVALSSWCAGATGLAALLAAIDAPRRRTAGPAVLFGAIAVLATAMHALPWVWTIKPFSQVQFAYRIIVVSEVAAVAAVCLAAVSGRPRRLAALMIAPAVLAGWLLVLTWPGLRVVTTAPVDPGGEALIASGRAPNEHLPAGYAVYPAFDDPDLMNGFPDRPLVALGGPGKVIAASGFPDGSVAMDLDLPAPATVTVKRFYFPSWRAERVDGRRKTPLDARPIGAERFTAFQAPAGRGVYRIRQVAPPIERVSDAITLVALLIVAGLLIAPRLRRARPADATP
jgi:hypothetical protein